MQILNYLSNTLKKIHLKNLSIRVKLDFSAKKRLRAIALVKYRIQPLTASRRTNPIFSPECGFGNQSHLAKHFRQKLGITPMNYRKNA